jgi:dipeptidyl aminopeptidase/acylaminoacyl peptidase
VAAADGRHARVLVGELASISEIAWSPDGRWLAIAAGREEGDSMVQLWLVDTGNGSLRRLGNEDFELDPINGALWHPDGDRLAVVSVRGSVQEIAIVDVKSGEPSYVRGGLRHVVGMSALGKRIAFVAASMRKLEEVYSVEWDGSDERRHTSFNRSWFRKRARPKVSLRRMRVPDGNGQSERIDAWLIRPAQGEGPFPLLVDMHGGPHSTVLVDFSSHTYWYELCAKGWAILAPNAVGSAGRGRQFAQRLRGRWGELDLPQYEAIIRKLQEEGFADDRVVCTGKSYGGFLSAWAVGHSDLFKAAVVCAPVTNITSHFGTSDTGFYVTPFAMDGEVHAVRERYDALSPISHCVNVRAAVLILQGENDGRCPRGQSEELFANLIRCTEAPAELVVYPTSTHSEAESGRPSNRVDYHSRIASWAERWTRRDG